MRQFIGGVTIVTAGLGEDRTGLTATAVASLSLSPPSMIICVDRAASAWPTIKRYRHFCVNILAKNQREIAERFAGRGGVKGRERYATGGWTALSTGALALDDALAAIDCEVEEYLERHTHSIVIGAVKALRISQGNALLRGFGCYGTYSNLEH